jgi:hypothetical protein
MHADLDAITREISPLKIRAYVAGINATIALTDTQVVMAESRPCEAYSELHCYPLAALKGIRCLCDTNGGLLALEFDDARTRVILFLGDSARPAEALVKLLSCPVKKVVQCDHCAAAVAYNAVAA